MAASSSFSSPMIQIQSLILLFLLLLPSSSSSSSSSNSTTIYEVLKSKGLPVGLLPKGITKYSMNDSSGEFEVMMEEPCNAKFENEVHYDSSIKGTLEYGQIGKLSGISAQELFLWFPVKGIRVDVPNSGVIHFDVGVADKQFAVSIFEAPPECTPQPDAGESDQSLWSVW
ncbi:hypothetical protein HN51_005968 [Arachis hypogaea]|uniref:DUF538 family protein n=2 Tax=Arachis TaxID=3817 RepID=A0A445DCM7_ARAHY|nr:uncharacterized protein LOC107485958 [Arachis duranensis]XP_025696376.1 uncharacterized protein LOC112797579 [Arachis hypogaea]QHO39812.1 uncharacterized protein DS421_4g132370 [Arachis hypogaea]RYR60926.1 hypothetical protein Ahy_A04g018019 [Arachis hypogaea]